MAAPIRFYLDFASPYAYFAAGRLRAIAEAHGWALDIRPVILWAVLKAQGIGDPMGSDARKAYMLADMERSADFFGVPFRFPDPFRISTHRAARLFHALAVDRPEIAGALATTLLESFFVRGENIAAPEEIAAVRAVTGLDGAAITALIEGPVGRDRLEATVRAAIDDGVVGSPFILVEGEGFFGADRLPQIEWRLGRIEDPRGRRS